MAKRKLTRIDRLYAYDQVVALARDNALIHHAAGGIVILCHPDVADVEGFTARLLQMADAMET